jgi:hypothetical protein
MGCNSGGPRGQRLAAVGLCALVWSSALRADDGAVKAQAKASVQQPSEPAPIERDVALAERCPSASAAVAATREQEVAELYKQFECRFLQRQYAAGLPYLEQACALKNSPRCLLNLAAVHHGLMHCELARSYYFRYLDVVPYDEASESAQHALDELASSCGAAAAAQVESAPEPPLERGAPPPSSVISALPAGASLPALPRTESRVPTPVTARSSIAPPSADRGSPIERRVSLWLLGAGAASGAGAVMALLYGARTERDAERRDRTNGALVADTDPELDAIDRAGRRSNRLAAVLGIGSGLLVGAGATLWIMAPGSGAALNLGADGTASVGYAGAF